MTYYAGDAITISAVFENEAGTATDPTDLTLVIRPHKGTGTVEEYNPGDIIKDSTGNFHLAWTAPAVEHLTMFEVQWIPTGAVQRSSSPERIYVAPVLE